ncbi:IS110 family transposase [Lentimicrobium sp. L6]|uniref:IS110 family transposase n=1 Tax=Lentimicrobium sp. L6 TaxID=2735916 RepID=UPI001C1300D4|nr:IS110 family transposase [Lentimicrobium sp. L6]
MIELLKYSVGVDVSKEKFDACLSVIDITQRVKVKASRNFDNSPSGIKQFILWIIKHKKEDIQLVIVMEATGVYYERIALNLHEQEFNVIVVLPNKAKKYIQSIGYKSKNDKIDAKALAQMGAEQRLALWQPYSEKTYELRSLTRQNEDLQKERTVILNRIEAQNYAQRQNKFVLRQLRSILKLIDKQIDRVKSEVEKCISADPCLKEKVENINTLKGVGILTIATVIAETNGFLLFNNQRQLVSYAGYDVVENQSGKKAGKTKISKKGNSHIRRALHFPAFNVVRYNPSSFGQLYQRAYASSGRKMKGYVAVQRKLLVIIYTLWKKNEAYDVEYEPSANDEQKPLFSLCSDGVKKVPA